MTTTSVNARTRITPIVKRQLADMVTPVSLYLKLRDHYANPVLLESNDFRSAENSISLIGLDPLATVRVQNGRIFMQWPNGERQESALEAPTEVPAILQGFFADLTPDATLPRGVINGLFGHACFDSVQYFDSLEFDSAKRKTDLPDLHYSLYRYVIGIDHFKESMYLLENLPEGEPSGLERLQTLISSQSYGVYNFSLEGEEESNLTDEAYRELVRLGKHHCQIGDVFQIVLSRQFRQRFSGDDFNVYRVLRSINPSPYLFYFDYGSYKIFGSSPESQMVIKNGIAGVNPIAGTYRRSGNDEEDRERAEALTRDPKENAEHIMLVDLARNDLGRHAVKVEVKQLKEVQYFSHVIHLVSKVEGKLDAATNPIQVFGDTFPAGTLSGAPKYKAIQLIDQYENINRSFYGGAIGYINFNGDMNQAIVIRSFLSLNNTLYYQAGAGIVAASNEESELQEVNNKLGALKKALEEAAQL